VPAKRQQSASLSTTDQQILNAAAAWYHTQLLNSPKPLRYLTAERGLTLETIRKMKIGYSNGRMLIRHIHAHGLPVTRLLTLRLVTGRYNELMCRRVIFPVVQDEDVVYMIGRATSEEGKRVKYLGLPDGLVHKQPLVKGTPRLGVIWVEGPFDVAALVQWGLDADYLLVGLLGTAHAQMRNIVNHCSPALPHYIALDQDNPGEQAAEKLRGSLQASSVGQVVRLRWAGAKDCGELLTHGRGGQNAFLHALATASGF
jgi:DNA primase